MKYGCPNKICKNFKKTDSIVRSGYYFRQNDSRHLPRYKCTCCGKRFSGATYSLAKWQKKRRINLKLLELLSSGVSMRRSALLLRVHRMTITNRLDFLSKLSLQENAKFLKRVHLKVDHFQFDDLITLEHTKLKPLTVPIAVDAKTRVILGAEVGKIPAFGPLSEKAKNKYGHRQNEHLKALCRLFKSIKPIVKTDALIKSDEHSRYAPIVSKFFPLATHVHHKSVRGCIAGQGELKKIKSDPLFYINHTCAMFRANVNRLIRRTWCTTKLPDNLKKHLNIYIYYHNSRLVSLS